MTITGDCGGFLWILEMASRTDIPEVTDFPDGTDIPGGTEYLENAARE